MRPARSSGQAAEDQRRCGQRDQQGDAEDAEIDVATSLNRGNSPAAKWTKPRSAALHKDQGKPLCLRRSEARFP